MDSASAHWARFQAQIGRPRAEIGHCGRAWLGSPWLDDERDQKGLTSPGSHKDMCCSFVIQLDIFASAADHDTTF
jgi:hypothetical protein